MKQLLLAGAGLAALLALPATGFAQPLSGPYVSLGAGYDRLQSEYLHTNTPTSGIPSGNARLRWGDGATTEASVGWGFGNGLRTEIEGFWSYSEVDSRPGSPVRGVTTGNSNRYGAFGNVLYDVDLGMFGINAAGIMPYIGVGAGYEWNHLSPITTANDDGTLDRIGGTNGSFAYQAIIGAAVPLHSILPGLDFTIDYRYIGALNGQAFSGRHYQPYGVNAGNVGLSQEASHNILVGFRYALWQPAPPPPPAPAPVAAPPPPVEQARTYLVFFDWDRADLSARARQIVSEAAQASTHVQTTRIEVNGYTDLSGTVTYNQGLSVRRAKSVEAELIRDGVAQNEIEIHGYGE
ncbi:MAG TPA: OmpA family protein, partial [Acetobacteraceae bacterium]|nr:OmpA family protein [Acetobacteraceae bacterium]